MLTIDGHSLTLADLETFLRPCSREVSLSEDARGRMTHSRAMVESILSNGETVYGVNTGFGKLKNTRIDDKRVLHLQRNLILSHCCGVGEPAPPEVVRISMLLRANALACGFSGIRPEVVDLLVCCLNHDVLPVVPRQGSVGASGDLAPLAHIAAMLIGEGQVTMGAETLSAMDALAKIGCHPVVLEAKEGLALINGTQFSAAAGGAALIRANRLARLADVACAMTLEALEGSLAPFDPRVAELRPHPGHLLVSNNIRALLCESRILESHANCDRVQDPYSLRCAPQVHGASRDALNHASEVLQCEVNAVTDNPLLFPDGDVISAGNFHAEPLAMVFDYAGIGAAELAAISERRVENLVNPDLSRGLPAFLTVESGVNSGFMMAQVTAAALVSENKSLAHPASVDSIPTSANQEDHVSMAPIAGLALARIVENAAYVIAIELCAVTQALRLRNGPSAGVGVEAARTILEGVVPPVTDDRILKNDFDAVRAVMEDGTLEAAVSTAVGGLK